jgi:hypothetical protein
LEESIFQKIKVWKFKEVAVGSWSYLVVDQPQKIAAPHSLGARRLWHSNIKVFFFFGVFLTMNFFTPKSMKIRWSSLFFGSFAPHFQIKLSIQGSNLNSIFVSMSELELFLLIGILSPNFNTVDLVNFF